MPRRRALYTCVSCWNKRRGVTLAANCCNDVVDDANNDDTNDDDDDAIGNPVATHTHVGPLNLHSQACLSIPLSLLYAL